MSAYNKFKIRYTDIYNKYAKKDIKVCFISDIHINTDVKVSILDKIIEFIKEYNPNYICIGGDLIDNMSVTLNDKLANVTKNFLTKLGEITKTFLIYGNHDFIIHKKDLKKLEHSNFWGEVSKIPNIYILDNNYYLDNNIYIMGYTLKDEFYHNDKKCEDADEFYEDFKANPRLYSNLPDNVIKIGLIHSPEIFKNIDNVNLLKNFDLILCGHFHNGCVPYFLDDDDNNGIIAPSKKLFPKYARGYREFKNGLKIITGGGITTISKESGIILRPLNSLTYRHMDFIRFNNKEKDTKISYKIKK